MSRQAIERDSEFTAKTKQTQEKTIEGKGGLRNGISVSSRIEKWQNDLWSKAKSREQVGQLIRDEYRKGNLTDREFEEAIKEVYTSLR
jgi:hypothetical protein